MTTNITEDHRRAFEALTGDEAGNFCLFSCFLGIVKLIECRLFSAFLHEAKLLNLRGGAIDNVPKFGVNPVNLTKPNGDTKVVRAFVKQLRQKLGDDAANPAWIFNVRGVGYRMPRPGDP